MLEYALHDAGLATARDHYADIPLADGLTTTFEIHAGGLDKSVAVYALDYSGAGARDLQARAGFTALADRLSGFRLRVIRHEVLDLGPFEPNAYLLTLDQPFNPDTQTVDWPWPDLMLDDFERTQGGWWTAIVTAEQAKELADPVNSVPNDVVVRAPDGSDYLVRIRPLLPDELL